MERVLPIHADALLWGIEQGLLAFGIAMIFLGVIVREVRPQRRWPAGVVALVISAAIGLHFADVQSAVVLRSDAVVPPAR